MSRFLLKLNFVISTDGANGFAGRNRVRLKSQARTVAMLGARMTSFESDENGTLALTFSDGQRITLMDSFKEYESYDITRPGETIIV